MQKQKPEEGQQGDGVWYSVFLVCLVFLVLILHLNSVSIYKCRRLTSSQPESCD